MSVYSQRRLAELRAQGRFSSIETNPSSVRAWRDRTARRLPAKSPGKAAAAASEAEIRDAVFARDRVCLLADLVEAGDCVGGPTFHHRRKASSGGAYTAANGALLCRGHNSRLESDADLAELVRAVRPWLIVREGDDEWELLGRRADRINGGTGR